MLQAIEDALLDQGYHELPVCFTGDSALELEASRGDSGGVHRGTTLAVVMVFSGGDEDERMPKTVGLQQLTARSRTV